MHYTIVSKNTEIEQRVKIFFSLIRDMLIEEWKRALSYLIAFRTLLEEYGEGVPQVSVPTFFLL